MKLEKMIELLTCAADKFGKDIEVKLVQGETELGFTLRAEMVLDPESETGVNSELIIDVDE